MQVERSTYLIIRDRGECVDFVEVPQLSPDYLPKCADRIIAMIDAIFNNEKRTDSFEDIYRVFLCSLLSKDR